MKLIASLFWLLYFITASFADDFASNLKLPLKVNITHTKAQIIDDAKGANDFKKILENYTLTSLKCNAGKNTEIEVVGLENKFTAQISRGAVIFYQGVNQELNGKFLISKPYHKNSVIRLDKHNNTTHKLFGDHVFASMLIDRHILWVTSFKEHENIIQPDGSVKLYEHSYNIFIQAGAQSFLELHKSCHTLHKSMEVISDNELSKIKAEHPLAQHN